MEDGPVENDVLASPFFTGSIADAIKIAKSEKRTLIVYIAGQNEDCSRMDQTTWKDHKVQKLIREQFVTLSLPHRSSDAAHFFAMYPYDGVPSVSVINNSGMLLRQLGGYIQPDELVDMLEQSLAVQAAATIVAALASANTSSAALPAQVQANSSSIASENSDSREKGSSSAHSDIEACCPARASTSEKFVDDGIQQIGHPNSSQINGQDATAEVQVGKRESLSQMQTTVAKSGRSEDRTEQVLGSTPCDLLSNVNMSQNAAASRDFETETKNQIADMDTLVSLEGKPSSTCQEEAPKLKLKQSAERFLIQVRLPNGKSIRESFNPKDNLAVVKKFVDQNRDDGNDAYSLVMLYPRKVFSQEDMEKSLMELSLEDRATLVLLTSPLQPGLFTSEVSGMQGVTPEVKDSSTNGGIWKILSYLNPLSYFSGSSDSSNNAEPGSSSWQYEPNPNLRNSIRQDTTEGYGLLNPNLNETNASKRKKAQDRTWGGNIHTLQHDDNDEAFKRGNMFWNGNSTQFGGDDSQK